MAAVAVTGLIVFYLVLIAGLVIIPLGFPGTWVMVVATLAYLLFGDLNPGGSEWFVLVVVALMAGLGELIELGTRIVGSKVARVSNGAIVAAIVGGLIGVIVGVPIFLIGSLLGLLFGVFLGAFFYSLVFEKNSIAGALWVALATTTSQVVALFFKTCIGLAIIIYLTIIIF